MQESATVNPAVTRQTRVIETPFGSTPQRQHNGFPGNVEGVPQDSFCQTKEHLHPLPQFVIPPPGFLLMLRVMSAGSCGIHQSSELIEGSLTCSCWMGTMSSFKTSKGPRC